MRPRQLKFCKYYLKDSSFNAADAARRAGYSPKAAKQIGLLLLTKPHVNKYITEKTRAMLAGDEADINSTSITQLREIANDPNQSSTTRIKAIETLLKYTGLLTERVELTGKDGGPLRTTYEPLPLTAKE